MKKNFVLLVLTLAITPLFSQNLPKLLNQANWQQKVNYSIQVELNTKSQSLQAFETITYFNNSPNTIHEVYMHLWPNAYKNRNTAYAKQHLENGNTDFHFAPDEDRGYIDSFDFKVNGQKVELITTENVDVAILKLNVPLLSGQQIVISTPFYVKLPNVFSRLGYEDSTYCITQWYPKPAVYDVNGWNPMPYLNQGEFYSEFGRFDVQITVPKNFVLAATGEVQDAKEKIWWLENTKNPTSHFSPVKTKTLQFVQDSVHDFAWFCSPLFKCAQSEVILPNGKRVETWAFGEPKNNTSKPSGISHVNDAVTFYSEKVGNYPYSIAQLVITPLKAGAGMEYPTITNCADDSKTTIIHEIGHNWFYGILASNERNDPWMDESINTYYETRFTKFNKNESTKNTNSTNLFHELNESDFLFRYSTRQNIDQPGNLHSTQYTDMNYGAIIYAKNPLGFRYLESYLGTQKFDEMMQAYFEKWKFKHPLPNDFKNHAQNFTNEDLSWFFEGLLGSNQKLDYKLISTKNNTLVVKNKGTLVAPLAISQKLTNGTYKTTWISGFNGTKKISISSLQFKDSSLATLNEFRIDAQSQSIDLYKQNNGSSKIKFQPILNTEKEKLNQIFYSPLYAYNLHNKSMLGLALYNSLLPQKRNEFVFAPLYSFTTKDLNGYAQFWHNWYPKGIIQKVQFGFKSARFASQGIFFNSGDPSLYSYFLPNSSGSYFGDMSYEKFAPFISFTLQPKNPRNNIYQNILARYIMINEQAIDRSAFYKFGSDHFGISEIKYTLESSNALYPYTTKVYLQNGLQRTNFNKIGVEFIQGFTYAKGKKKKAEIRLFTGAFLFQKTQALNSPGDHFSQRVSFQGASNSGANDYLYDETMIGRMAPPKSSYSHQILLNESGFRNFANVGTSNSILSALNITIPLPIPVPIGAYADFSYWQSPSGYTTVGGVAGSTTSFFPAKMNLTYNGGIYISIVKNVFSIYVPVISSSDVSGYWEVNGHESIFSRTSFVLNLNNVNPINLIRNMKL